MWNDPSLEEGTDDDNFISISHLDTTLNPISREDDLTGEDDNPEALEPEAPAPDPPVCCNCITRELKNLHIDMAMITSHSNHNDPESCLLYTSPSPRDS